MSKTVKAFASGVIVDSSYDSLADIFPFFESLIEKGVITPASRFLAQVSQAAPGDTLEVHVNSFGGDVFAANSMILAAKRFARANPGKLAVVVEAVAMSAGASMVAALAPFGKVTAFRESVMMFHSATTFTCGGPGAHQDSMDLLNMINSSIKASILSRTNLSREVVDGWFQESRMGWLMGEAIRDCRLADELSDDVPAPMPPPVPEEKNEKIADCYNYYARQIASLTSFHNQTGAPIMAKPRNEDPEKEEQKPLPVPEGDEQEPETGSEGEEQEQETGSEGEEQEPQPSQEEEEKDRECQQLKAENASLKTRIQQLEQKLVRFTAGFRGGSPGNSAGGRTFQEMLDALPKNLSSSEWDEQFFRLKNRNPALFQDFMSGKK